MKWFKDIIGTQSVNGILINRLTRTLDITGFLNDSHVYTHHIKDGQTAESLADEKYGNADLWYIIFIINEIHDRFYDWPMNNNCLRDYFQYLISTGEMTDTSVNWNIIKTANDAKREIKLLKSEYIEELLHLIEQTVGVL